MNLPITRLHGRLRVVVQAVWLSLAVLLYATFAAGVPVRLNSLLRPVAGEDPALFAGFPPALVRVLFSRLGPEELHALQSIGLSQGFYAGYILTFEVALALACAIIGLLIFWRRSDDWMALWFSLSVVLVGGSGTSLVVPSLAAVWPGAGLVSAVVGGFVGMISLVHILFLSPDGRFVPRWTLAVAAGTTGFILASGLYSVAESWRTQVVSPIFIVVSTMLVVFLVWVGSLGLGVLNQIYRYRWVSGPVQRQQTKWLIVGLAAVVLGLGLNAFLLYVTGQQSGLPRLLYYLVRAPLVNLCMSLLPICLAFSIFRYRLWDIDLIIRRTLIYSLLTGSLALSYLASIVVLQALFETLTGQAQSPLVTALSTLTIAALFLPLRRRVQEFIDKRFYRQKYEAQKVLAQFAATCRDETDLDKLTARLLEVVQETMQPEHVTLWLKPTADRRRRTVASGQPPAES